MHSISSTLPQNKLMKMGIILLVLATFDALFTDFGIQSDHITEANPIMRSIYEVNVIGFYFIKIALPVLLIGIVTKLESKPFILILMNLSLFLYVSVLILHFFWLTLALDVNPATNLLLDSFSLAFPAAPNALIMEKDRKPTLCDR